MAKPIRVLLYYKYVPIENAEQFAADTWLFVKSIGLKGRILVADEGINGTVSGDYETTQNTWTTFIAFQGWRTFGSRLMRKKNKLSRRCLFATKKEIVHLGLGDNNFDSDINPFENYRCLLVTQRVLKTLFG